MSHEEGPDRERLSELRKQGVDTLVIGACDLTGEFRAKRFALDLMTREDVEIAFSDYVFGADVAEELMTPRPEYVGYFPQATLGLPDIYVRPDWSQLRVLPWDPRTAVVLGDWYTHSGEELPVSPRGVLRRVLTRLSSVGYHPVAGCEFEFFIYKGDPADPTSLVPISAEPRAYGYGRGSDDESIFGVLRRMMDEAGIPIEASHPEAAPGQSEITIRYADAMQAADYAFLYKHFVRELVAREGLTASFIAKNAKDGYGSSGHLHVSLRDSEGEPQMIGADGDLSETTHRSIAGFLDTLPEFMSFYAPVVNSYRRYQTPYSFAGDTVAWGLDNRTCAVRMISAGRNGSRLEIRTPGADMNPYVSLAATLAGLGHGLEQNLKSPAPIAEDAYDDPAVRRVPNDLSSAVALLERSDVARDWLGTDFTTFYAESRFWEAEQHRLAVTDWEFKRYL